MWDMETAGIVEGEGKKGRASRAGAKPGLRTSVVLCPRARCMRLKAVSFISVTAEATEATREFARQGGWR